MKQFLLFVLTLLPVAVNADESGWCAPGVYYSYNSSTHTLTVYGSGTMKEEVDGAGDIPWSSYKSDIQSLIVEQGVTSIGTEAFDGCTALNSVTIPSSVTTIGENSFSGCSSLTSITIPNSVTSIGMSAFNGCIGLTSIMIPNSVKWIGNGAFRGCSGLASITIPSSVTSIGGSVFSGCSSLEAIIVESGNPNYDSRNGCNAIIKKETNTLISGCNTTTIPNSVTTIGEYAFSGCRLTSVTIPNSVTSIGMSAFNGCTGLTSIMIPNSVKWTV